MNCKICGAEMTDDASFCPKCGCNNKINSMPKINQVSVFTPSVQTPRTKMPTQTIQLIIEVIISAIIIFAGAMILIFGAERSWGIFPITTGIALLYMLIKNPPISKKDNTQNYNELKKIHKPQGATRVVFIIVSVIFTFLCLLVSI